MIIYSPHKLIVLAYYLVFDLNKVPDDTTKHLLTTSEQTALEDSTFKTILLETRHIIHQHVQPGHHYRFIWSILTNQNDELLPPDIPWNVLKKKFEAWIKTKGSQTLFQKYQELTHLNTQEKALVHDALQSVLGFLNTSQPKKSIIFHLNLLDQYNRDTNYQTESESILCVAPTEKQRINVPSLRHEFMHTLLRPLWEKVDLSQLENVSIPTSEEYRHDRQCIRFEENFILAASLCFLSKASEQSSNLKCYRDIGFERVDEFSEVINRYFVREQGRLDSEFLNRMIKDLR